MKIKSLVLPLMAFCVLGFTSCSDDNGPGYSASALKNTELMTILKSKGYTFDQEGKLELNDLANNTTSLDLSGTKLTDFTGLDILPNLKEVKLANNDYGPSFDFAKLPAQITGIDLTGNDIYDFAGLVKTEIVNDEIKTTILHPLTRLYLPATAKYNVEDLMPFYKENQLEKKAVDMQMIDSEGSLKAYNTIRLIPDEYFREYLKTKFSSIFVNETSIDISLPMALKAQGENIMLGYMTPFPNLSKIKSIEGVEYFVNNPFYKSFGIALKCPQHCSISYLSPRGNIRALLLNNIDTPSGIDFSGASGLSSVQLIDNSVIEAIDLSHTLVGNQDASKFDVLFSNSLQLQNCNNLQEVVFNPSGVGIFDGLHIAKLPKLKKLDLSFAQGFQILTLLQIPNCTITYPINLKYYYDGASGELAELSEINAVSFGISKDVYDQTSTKDFITRYGKFLTDTSDDYSEYDGYKWH